MDAIVRKKVMKQLHGTSMTISGPGHSTWMNCHATGVDPNNPFKSEAQRKYLFSQKPEIAKEFAKKTPKGKKLPKKVKK